MKKLLNRVLFSKSATAFSQRCPLFPFLFLFGKIRVRFVDNVLYTGFSLGLFVFTAIGYVCLLTVLNAKVKRKFLFPKNI